MGCVPTSHNKRLLYPGNSAFTIADRIVQVHKILILGESIQYFWVVLFVLRNPDRIT